MADNEVQLVSTSWVIFVTLLFSVYRRHSYCALMCKTKNVYNVCWVSLCSTPCYHSKPPSLWYSVLFLPDPWQNVHTIDHCPGISRLFYIPHKVNDQVHCSWFYPLRRFPFMRFFNGWNEGVSILGLHSETGNTNTKQAGLPALHPLYRLVIQDTP